ncbi:MAG: serine--tRNA ligase [Bacteroidetes bacterium]|jgi:seryl-tRNA synthetase|nr:serine--tRNA ligase [Bacteroidota bacterium]|tara:strand:- start:21947 stop:23212 length:1266 start_codon:yes stop_codon:yes gene_type:complete
MLQVSTISENLEKITKSMLKRNIDIKSILEKIIETDNNRRSTQSSLDNSLASSNQLAKEIGEFFKSGETKKAGILKEKASFLKKESKNLSEKLSNIIKELNNLLLEVPNIPHKLVPSGSTESDNKEIFKWGSIPELKEAALPHWELASKYDIIDFELGNKITGAGFPVYKDKGAKLQRALINYFLDKNTNAGYKEFQVPILVNEDSGTATGQLPDKEGQMYYIKEDNLYLAPTAEVPVTNIFRNTIVKASELPICLTSYTPCFRREAGSYGSHVRGLNRLHQFDKVEIVRIEDPENSYRALDSMVDHVKGILEELDLPFRILRLCGGDLGFTSCLTYDFEVYSAAQKRWLEVSSVSNFESFQSNRLKLRIDKGENKVLAHTLNGSSLALPRIVACILENYQKNDGIHIPKALVPYTGFEKI